MNSISMAFFLTFMAGFSTMLGIIPIFIKLKNETKIIAGSLAFAAGVMTCVSVTDLIPEAVIMLENQYNGALTIILTFLFIMLGMTISNFIDKNIPITSESTSLYKVGLISMLAIILHNLPEGIVTFISTTKDTSLGISLAIAIALHNIPEGISISVPLYYSTKRKRKAISYTFISSLSEPLGALLTYLFLLPIINEVILGLLFAFIAGIMIQISFTELLPTSTNYQMPVVTKTFFVIGTIFMLIKFFL